MRNQLFTWPSVQVDPNIPKISNVNTGSYQVENILNGAPEDSDTIVELLAKISQMILEKTDIIQTNINEVLNDDHDDISLEFEDDAIDDLFEYATTDQIDAAVVESTADLATETYVDNAVTTAFAAL